MMIALAARLAYVLTGIKYAHGNGPSAHQMREQQIERMTNPNGERFG
ncbi:hypothetical protein [Burkholderia ubonensis]|nr:hypothetical protein [Burkholderia ubonensis]